MSGETFRADAVERGAQALATATGCGITRARHHAQRAVLEEALAGHDPEALEWLNQYLRGPGHAVTRAVGQQP